MTVAPVCSDDVFVFVCLCLSVLINVMSQLLNAALIMAMLSLKCDRNKEYLIEDRYSLLIGSH